MSYRYTCRICGAVLTGGSEDGLVQLVQHHYVNQHGLDRRTDRRRPGLEYDEDAIREDIEETD